MFSLVLMYYFKIQLKFTFRFFRLLILCSISYTASFLMMATNYWISLLRGSFPFENFSFIIVATFMKFNTRIGNLISSIFCFHENFSTPIVSFLFYRKRTLWGDFQNTTPPPVFDLQQ